MMNDLKHLGLPRRRARPDWILGIAAGVAFLGLISWMSSRDAEYRSAPDAPLLARLAAEYPETPSAGEPR